VHETPSAAALDHGRDDKLFGGNMAIETGATSAGGFWELDEPLPHLRDRVMRAAAVSGVWGLALLPVAFGWQRCTIAAIFHRPCPGCGMTRAIHLLLERHAEASFRMHPLAVPVLATGVLFMASTVWSTFVLGSPFRLHRSRLGQVAIAIAAIVYAAAFAVWVVRWFGYLGGPVVVG
jgi:hypothetical protein